VKLSKKEQEYLLKSYLLRWPHEEVQFIHDEFMWVTTKETGSDNPDPQMYPLLGHVCDIAQLCSKGVKFYHRHMSHLDSRDQLDEEYKCVCEPNPFPKALKMRVTLLSRKGL
jgi:hypothetical protein